MHSHTAWMIIPTFYPVIGGAQSQVQRLSQALIGQNWQVKVLTRQHSYAHPDGLAAHDTVDGVPVRRLYSRGGSKIGSLLYLLGGLWHLWRKRHFTIYHAHDISAAGWLAVAARYLCGGRCLVKLRTGRYAYERYFTSGLARWQFLSLLRLADRVIVVNREVETYIQTLGIPAGRIVCIPNGVDTDRFSPVPGGQKAALRQQLGMTVAEKVVLYVGRLEHLKGVDILLQGWAGLPDDVRQDSRLFIVGDGPDRQMLEETAVHHNITNSVIFTGAQSNVVDYYRAADLFVLPSRTEGLSNALVEAMACALPVVASDVGGALDVVVEGESGALFASEDSKHLAHVLENQLREAHRWPAQGQHARQTICAYADLAHVMVRLQRTYEQLLDDTKNDLA